MKRNWKQKSKNTIKPTQVKNIISLVTLKKMFLLIALALSFTDISAQDNIAKYTINQFAGDEYHEDLSIDVQYHSESDKIYLDVDARKISKFIILDKSERQKLVEMLQKILEWNKKAIEQKAVFEKEVGSITVSGGFYYGSKYRFSRNNKITLKFEGSENSDGYSTMMFMVIPRMEASDNEYIDVDHNLIFLKEDGINELIAGLTTAIDKYIEEKKQNENVANQFN